MSNRTAKTGCKHASIYELPDMVTVAQFADVANVSRYTVYRLIEDGEIKAVRIRGQYRISREAAREYLGL